MRWEGRRSPSKRPPRAAVPLGDPECRTLPQSAPPEALCRGQQTRSLKRRTCGGRRPQFHTSVGDEDVISGRSRKPGEAGALLQVRADACSVYTAALEAVRCD